MTHEFLTAGWIEAARAIRDEYSERVTAPPVVIRMNQLITAGPDGVDIETHIDTSNGHVSIELGHLPKADVTITTDYGTARALFVEQDAQAAMAAFMGGKIKVEGDFSKLLALQGYQVEPVAQEIAERIRSITADMRA